MIFGHLIMTDGSAGDCKQCQIQVRLQRPAAEISVDNSDNPDLYQAKA